MSPKLMLSCSGLCLILLTFIVVGAPFFPPLRSIAVSILFTLSIAGCIFVLTVTGFAFYIATC